MLKWIGKLGRQIVDGYQKKEARWELDITVFTDLEEGKEIHDVVAVVSAKNEDKALYKFFDYYLDFKNRRYDVRSIAEYTGSITEDEIIYISDPVIIPREEQ